MRPRRTPPPARKGLARTLPRTVAGRVRTLTALALALLLGLLGAAWWAVASAREGVQVIGYDAGPQVVATGDLYFQLTEMDAQLADALLIGGAPGGGRDRALAAYDRSRAKAGEALLQAAKLADEYTEDTTARELVFALGRYERLATQALDLDRRAGHTSGAPPQNVVLQYRAATDLMKLDLLPKAYNLTLDNGTLVRHTYEDRRSDVLDGRTLILVTGVALLVVLVGLQVYMAARFRRTLNPALALATLLTLVLTGVSAVMLSGQANHLRDAKDDGFDSILALSRARAISNSANADETRYLIDPGRADSYEQVFLSKSQTVLYLKAGNLNEYNQAVQKGLDFERGRVPFLGFFGTEASRSTDGRQRGALVKVLEEYRRFQANDRRMRDLVNGGQRAQAVAAHDAAAGDYVRYDKSLQSLIEAHQAAFRAAVADGEGGTEGWYGVLPVAGVIIIALTLIGVRPRLAEYRWSR
ncbi:hypothetical protein GNZ18_35890 [Actinomadura sp. NEAU-AAG5]|uniref:Secreted protein n=1 Tax=Actinomadura litoris TaxID=2678616 RepID=A0A7K1LBZ0_9ACTN|nr:hypothetical protein [Actinomadura sp. NEAU-AAG7]MUN41932.1 hypothetical protein [Actinomadura litoris]